VQWNRAHEAVRGNSSLSKKGKAKDDETSAGKQTKLRAGETQRLRKRSLVLCFCIVHWCAFPFPFHVHLFDVLTKSRSHKLTYSSLFAPINRFRDLYPARGRGGRDDDSFFDRRMRSLVELELVTESSAEDTFLRRGSQKDRVDKPRRLFPTCLGFIRGFRRSIELF
jgi:hypothetical protein